VRLACTSLAADNLSNAAGMFGSGGCLAFAQCQSNDRSQWQSSSDDRRFSVQCAFHSNRKIALAHKTFWSRVATGSPTHQALSALYQPWRLSSSYSLNVGLLGGHWRSGAGTDRGDFVRWVALSDKDCFSGAAMAVPDATTKAIAAAIMQRSFIIAPRRTASTGWMMPPWLRDLSKRWRISRRGDQLLVRRPVQWIVPYLEVIGDNLHRRHRRLARTSVASNLLTNPFALIA